MGPVARADPDRIGKRRGVQNVARLCDRQVRVAIDEHDLRTDTTHHHRISRGGANLSGADDADFHGRSSRIDVEVFILAHCRLASWRRERKHPRRIASSS